MGSIPVGDSDFFSLSHAGDNRKITSFSIFRMQHNLGLWVVFCVALVCFVSLRPQTIYARSKV